MTRKLGLKIGTAAPTFSAVAVDFDGTNDSINASAGTMTFGASKKGIFSFWFYLPDPTWPNTVWDVLNLRTGGGTQRFYFQLVSSGRFNLTLDATTGTAVSWGAPTDTFAVQTWTHLAISWDTAVGKFQAYKSRTNLSPTATVNNVTPDWANVTRSVNDAIKMYWSEVYLNTEEDIDFSNSANLDKFITSGGKPVNLGSDGSTPTGSAPEIYLGNPVASWHTNKGTAGGFTLTGALTAAPSSPSD